MSIFGGWDSMSEAMYKDQIAAKKREEKLKKQKENDRNTRQIKEIKDIINAWNRTVEYHPQKPIRVLQEIENVLWGE